jgi:hypothetical protein
MALITLQETADNHDYCEIGDFLENECYDAEVPATCFWDCWVPRNGYCAHGCPSALIVAGIAA